MNDREKVYTDSIQMQFIQKYFPVGSWLNLQKQKTQQQRTDCVFAIFDVQRVPSHSVTQTQAEVPELVVLTLCVRFWELFQDSRFLLMNRVSSMCPFPPVCHATGTLWDVQETEDHLGFCLHTLLSAETSPQHTAGSLAVETAVVQLRLWKTQFIVVFPFHNFYFALELHSQESPPTHNSALNEPVSWLHVILATLFPYCKDHFPQAQNSKPRAKASVSQSPSELIMNLWRNCGNEYIS